MKFSKELLQELVYIYPGESLLNVKVFQRDIIGQRRWSTDYTQVFEMDGHYYRTNFDLPSTELQEGMEPYEYESDEIELKEVFAHDETTIRYY